MLYEFCVCPFDLAKNFVLICEKVHSVARVISDSLGKVFQCDRPGAIGKIAWKPGLIGQDLATEANQQHLPLDEKAEKVNK